MLNKFKCEEIGEIQESRPTHTWQEKKNRLDDGLKDLSREKLQELCSFTLSVSGEKYKTVSHFCFGLLIAKHW